SKAVFQFAVLSTKNTMFGRVAWIVGSARKMSVSSPTGSTNCADAMPVKARAVRETRSLRRIMGISARSASHSNESGGRARRTSGQRLDRHALPDGGFGAGEGVAHDHVEFPGRSAGLRVEKGRRECLAVTVRHPDGDPCGGPRRRDRDQALVAEEALGDDLVDHALRD